MPGRSRQGRREEVSDRSVEAEQCRSRPLQWRRNTVRAVMWLQEEVRLHGQGYRERATVSGPTAIEPTRPFS